MGETDEDRQRDMRQAGQCGNGGRDDGKGKKERMALTERRMTNERKSDRERTVLRHAWFFFPGVVLFGHVQSDLLGSP